MHFFLGILYLEYFFLPETFKRIKSLNKVYEKQSLNLRLRECFYLNVSADIKPFSIMRTLKVERKLR